MQCRWPLEPVGLYDLQPTSDVQHVAHFGQGERFALLGNPGVLHTTSLAKYAVAFFRISFSRLSRRFSARSLDNSISSGVTTLPPAPLSLPSAAALTQLRKVWSLSPCSLQTLLTLCPSLIRLTASSLNSIVYAYFGIFISCLPKVTQFYVTLGRRNFGGGSFVVQAFSVTTCSGSRR